ncbi:MAG: S-layer homology domain-containing protein, partial [Clostridia bacterium]|nr:S-layer homology domain-containing protein [Clostridia bacterium]
MAVTLMLVVASMAPFAPAPPARTKSFPTAPFPDAATHWAAAEISRARAAGYVQGYPDGSFRPDRPVTNAELVRMLVAALGVAPVPGGPARYEDVRGHWVQEEGWLDAAEASGLLDPEEDAGQGRFFPDASAERRWAIVLAVRAAGGGDDARRAAVEAAPLQGFVDREAFHGMEGYVSVATAWGLVHGYPDGRWEPNRALTRAEAVVLAERVLAAVGGPIGQWPTYTNARYGVALQHPPGWKPDPRYPGGERWRGTTGFF